MYRFTILLIFSLHLGYSLHADSKEDLLNKCYTQQAVLKEPGVRVFEYEAHTNTLYHSPRPWMVINRTYKGTLWSDNKRYAKLDSFVRNEKAYVSKELYKDGILLQQPYWAKGPVDVSEKEIKNIPIDIAAYDPAILLEYFKNISPKADACEPWSTMYTARINESDVVLYINKDNGLLEKVAITSYDEMYGDVTDTIKYLDHIQYKRYYYAQKVLHKKINGITDTIKLWFTDIVADVPGLIEKPDGYKVQPEVHEHFDIITTKISNNLHLFHLTQAESAALLAEFKDFFVLIDAPLNSRNGELILNEVKKINPAKPIKYFAFGHHHPWYLGGVRPIIHDGITILTQDENIPYINFLANAPHQSHPDSLQIRRKKPVTRTFTDSFVISDGNYKMVMYHIGEKSEHTSDYTVFYFPKEKLLFEDDMVFIKEGEPIKKAGGKQKALYNALEPLGLEIETIIQGWPWGDKYKFKTTIPFSDLEASMQAE